MQIPLVPLVPIGTSEDLIPKHPAYSEPSSSPPEEEDDFEGDEATLNSPMPPPHVPPKRYSESPQWQKEHGEQFKRRFYIFTAPVIKKISSRHSTSSGEEDTTPVVESMENMEKMPPPSFPPKKVSA